MRIYYFMIGIVDMCKVRIPFLKLDTYLRYVDISIYA